MVCLRVQDDEGHPAFELALSVEMNAYAFQTLTLRTFFREFSKEPPGDYYSYLRQEIDRQTLYDAHIEASAAAADKCWHAKLGVGGESTQRVRDRIDQALGGEQNWVLVGGPPCQAYSLAGRARNSGNPDYNPHQDERQLLYIEYLQALADHRPTVFVMENVKGLLSATLANKNIFQQIVGDLRNPAVAIEREGRSVRPGKPWQISSILTCRTRNV